MFVSVIKWCAIEFCKLAANIKTIKQMTFSRQNKCKQEKRVKEMTNYFFLLSDEHFRTYDPLVCKFLDIFIYKWCSQKGFMFASVWREFKHQ